jgi:glycosyltransferase involved in cell wall biosynthesis
VISGIHAYHKRDITSMRNNKCIAVERFAAVRRKGEAREVKDCSPVMRHIGDAGTVINKRGEVHPRNESANGHFTTTTIRPDALGAVAGQRPGCGGIFGLSKVAFLGNYIPRRCGLATFTADLRGAVIERYPDLECPVVAVNDRPFPYDYPSEVCLEIFEPNLGSYRLASTFLNLANVDVLCVQHEFGIFGGVEGSHVLTLLKAVKMPVVTTLHTVLQDPSSEQRRILEEVVRLSDRVVVMSRKAAHFLRDIYDVAEERIDIIPHGIPDFRFVDPDSYKEQCGLARKRTVFTFGLLSPNKGIENVINALPQVIAKFPDVIYVIAGTTHPNLVRDRGEEYRLSLEQLVRKRGAENHVMFLNRFIDLQELTELIGAADIYVTPYLKREQITSGALSYGIGAGKAIVSTPYWHASELLTEDKGTLVPFDNPDAIARAINELLSDEKRRRAMARNAYRMGREMVWSNVASLYRRSFEHALRKAPAAAGNTFTRQAPTLSYNNQSHHLCSGYDDLPGNFSTNGNAATE